MKQLIALSIQVLCLMLLCFVDSRGAFAQNKIMQTGIQFHGIRDYRQVMPGALYRGGANNGHAPLNQGELDALCDAGFGSAFSCAPMAFWQKRGTLMAMRTRIKELRARYDLTQDDLAKKVGVRRETILFIEKGNYNPSLKLAHDIAKALQTTIDDLFIFEDS